MKRFLKVTSWTFLTTAVILAIAVTLLLNLDYNEYRYLVEAEVRERTGRDLEIRGNMDLDLSLTPSIRLTDVHFANAEWGSEPEMASLKRLEAKIDLMPLILDGVLDIHTVEVEGLKLLVEKAPSGLTNLEFEAPAGTAGGDAGVSSSSAGESSTADVAGLSLPILRNVDLSAVEVRYVDIAAADSKLLKLDSLQVKGEGPFDPLQVDLSGSADDIPVSLKGELGSPSDMLNSERLWVVDLTGDLAGTLLSASGGIDEPATGKGLNIFLSLESEQVGSLSRITLPLLGQTIPNLGPVKLFTALNGDAQGKVSARDISLQLGGAKLLNLDVSGDVEDVLNLAGLKLKAEIKASSLERLGNVIGQDLPDYGALDASVELTGSQKALRAENLAMSLSGSKMDLKLTGGLNNLLDLASGPELDLRVEARLPELADITEIPDVTLPDLGSVNLTANLKGQALKSPQANDIAVEIRRRGQWRFQVGGAVSDLVKANGLDLTASAQIVDGAAFPKIEGQTLPDLGQIDFEGRIKGGLDLGGEGAAAGKLALEGLKLRVSREGAHNISLQGAIADLMAQRGIDLDVDANLRDLSSFSSLAGQALPPVKNLDVKGRLAGDADGQVSLNDFAMKFGKSRIAGQFDANLSETAPALTGRLESRKIFLRDMLPFLASAPAQETAGSQAGNSSSGGSTGAQSGQNGRVFSSQPFDLARLRKIALNMDLTVDQLVMPNGEPQKISGLVTMKGGIFDISNLEMRDPEAGALSGLVRFDASTDQPTFNMSVKADGYPLSNLTQFTNFAGLMRGPFDLDVDLDGRGSSPAAVAASLNGKIMAVATDTVVDRKTAQDLIAGGPLVAGLVPGEGSLPLSLSEIATLVPRFLGNSKRKQLPDQLDLHCMVADYGVQNGLITTKTLLLDSKYFTTTGEGTVDLGSERLDLTITPQRLFGVSEVAATHHIRGTLANPVSETDVVGSTLGTIGNLLKLPVTTMKSVGIPVGEDSPCVNLRPSNLKKQEEEAARQQATPQQEPQQRKDPEDELKDLGKNLLRNLLGG